LGGLRLIWRIEFFLLTELPHFGVILFEFNLLIFSLDCFEDGLEVGRFNYQKNQMTFRSGPGASNLRPKLDLDFKENF
jgi:hypothetical protein